MASPGVYAFEAIDDGLPFVPLAARRVLDALGRKLALEGWLSLSLGERREILSAGLADSVEAGVAHVVDRAKPSAAGIPVAVEPDPATPPKVVLGALGADRPLRDDRWRTLRAIDRYVLAKCASKPEKLARAYDEIVGPAFSHLTPAGAAFMVDVRHKSEAARRAVATACVRTTPEVVHAITSGRVAKGDVLAVARTAGILASKRTPELVPLCHPVRTTHAAIDFEADVDKGELRVRATIEAVDRTGVEMEAMVATAVASLTVYDMIKSADRCATIDAVRLEAKSGGKSGEWTRPPDQARR